MEERKREMGKIKLTALILSPIVIGTLMDTLIEYVPPFGYFAPLLLMSYWFWAGGVFAKGQLSGVQSTVSANILGLTSLCLFCTKNMVQGNSRRVAMKVLYIPFINSSFSFFTGKVGYLFEATSYEVTSVTSMVMQSAGFLVMVIVFISGYSLRRNRIEAEAKEKSFENKGIHIL